MTLNWEEPWRRSPHASRIWVSKEPWVGSLCYQAVDPRGWNYDENLAPEYASFSLCCPAFRKDCVAGDFMIRAMAKLTHNTLYDFAF